jgi:hypothetical protein
MPDQQTTDHAADASLGDLVGRLSEQSSRLIRDELALARTELQQSVKHAGIGAGLFGAAGFFAVLGVITLVGAAVAALSLLADTWLAALIVAVLLFAIAGVGALAGKKQVAEVGPPEQAIENVKKDIAEVKEHRS